MKRKATLTLCITIAMYTPYVLLGIGAFDVPPGATGGKFLQKHAGLVRDSPISKMFFAAFTSLSRKCFNLFSLRAHVRQTNLLLSVFFVVLFKDTFAIIA